MEPIATLIKDKLEKKFTPTQLDVIDESHKHAGHAGMAGRKAAESHFHVIIVSEKFSGMNTLAKHRSVMDVLSDLMKEKVHALRLEAKAPE
ncbi:MAG: BolA family protein [Robiginitomaculum sp.]